MRSKLGLGTALVAMAFAASAAEQPVGRTTALSHAIHAVNDLDTTLAFYRDVFGIDGKAVAFPNPGVALLTNAPGVMLRLSMVALPGGTRFEFTHFTGLERQPAQAKYWDPGAASLVLYVRDIDALVAAAKKAKATVVTTGGAPIEIDTGAGKQRSIVLRDPDGYFLQLVQEAPAAGAPEGSIHRVALAFTMEDAAATKRFYGSMLNIELKGDDAFGKDPAFARLIGAPESVEFRRARATLPPGTAVNYTEVRGVPRTKFHLRVRDPGAPALCVQVENIEGMVGQMKAAGVNLISAKGELVDFGNGVRNIFVEDPNGLNIELFERPATPPKQN